MKITVSIYERGAVYFSYTFNSIFHNPQGYPRMVIRPFSTTLSKCGYWIHIRHYISLALYRLLAMFSSSIYRILNIYIETQIINKSMRRIPTQHMLAARQPVHSIVGITYFSQESTIEVQFLDTYVTELAKSVP